MYNLRHITAQHWTQQNRTEQNVHITDVSSTYRVEVAAEGRENPPKEFDPRTSDAEEAGVTEAWSVVNADAGAGAGSIAPNDKDAELPILMKIMIKMLSYRY